MVRGDPSQSAMPVFSNSAATPPASKHFTGINNVETVVTAQRHNHPGGAYSYRIERNGKVLVVCTDVEHGEQIDPRLVKLARGADLLVHDAQYTAEEQGQIDMFTILRLTGENVAAKVQFTQVSASRLRERVTLNLPLG